MATCSECKWFKVHAVVPTKGACLIDRVEEKEKKTDVIGTSVTAVREKLVKRQGPACERFTERKIPYTAEGGSAETLEITH